MRAEQHQPRAWRPIALLNTIGKAIESVTAKRLADTPESNNLLPGAQMGNRKARSTELAAKLLTDAVHKAWSDSSTASLLQLYLQGDFDSVHHGWLVHTLSLSPHVYPPGVAAPAIARWNAGETPLKALDGLRSEYTEARDITLPDIRNFSVSHRLQELAGRSPILTSHVTTER